MRLRAGSGGTERIGGVGKQGIGRASRRFFPAIAPLAASGSLAAMAFDSFREFLNRLEAAGEQEKVFFPAGTRPAGNATEGPAAKQPPGGPAALFLEPT